MLQEITIQNFKSIRDQRVKLNQLNLLIGQNGAGKSNFISLFFFLEKLSEQQLADYIFKKGGIESFLFGGYQTSSFIKVEMEFRIDDSAANTYQFSIASNGEDYSFQHERAGYWQKENFSEPIKADLRHFGKESGLKRAGTIGYAYSKYVYDYIRKLKVFHFHDTSDIAPVKLPQAIEDSATLNGEAQNLAPFLYMLRQNQPDTYFRIVEAVRLVYPNFHDFVLEESTLAKGKIALRWTEQGGNRAFSARQISDGTLRFICLATVLLQPPGVPYMPQTLVIDEPELGLHPFALHVLAELITKATLHRQLIIATQSVNLINYFQPNDLLIVNRTRDGATEFSRKSDDELEEWLDEYQLGQLWEMNFLGGKP